MGNGTLESKTIKGILWSFTDLFSRQGIQLLIHIVLARLLLPEHFGLIGMLAIFIAVSKSLVQSGLDQALIREKEPTQEDYSTVFYFNLFVSFLIYIIIYISAEPISLFFNEPELVSVIRVLMIIIIINAFGIIQRVVLIRKVDFKTQTTVTIIAGVISGIIAILSAIFGLGVWSLVIQTVLMQSIEVILLFVKIRWYPSLVFSYNSFKRLFDFGYKLLITGLIDTFYKNIYFIIIGRNFTAAHLGYYTNATKLVDVTSGSIHLALNKVTYPVLSKIKDNQKNLSIGYKRLIKMTSFINFPLMLGLAAVAPNLIPFLLGDQWIMTIGYFQLLCIAGMIFPINGFNINILKVRGRTDLILLVELLRKLCLSILIVIAVLLKSGIVGLIFAAILDTYLSLYIISFFSGREISYKFTQQIRDMIINYINSILMALIVYYVGQYLNTNFLIELIIQVIIGMLIYTLLSITLKSNEVTLIYSIFRKVFTPKSK